MQLYAQAPLPVFAIQYCLRLPGTLLVSDSFFRAMLGSTHIVPLVSITVGLIKSIKW